LVDGFRLSGVLAHVGEPPLGLLFVTSFPKQFGVMPPLEIKKQICDFRILSNADSPLRVRKRDQRRVGQWVRSERLRAELNQIELSRKMKLGGQTVVSNIETGERRLDVVEFLELAKALDVPAATLLNRLVAYLADSRS
jgi:hypothetical protein